MAKPLTFKIGEKQYSMEPVKLERRKLYGYSEILAVDAKGQPCSLVTLLDDGKTLVPRGGYGLGQRDAAGNWVEKSELVPQIDGKTVQEKVPSSFSAPIILREKVSVDDFLLYDIESVYTMQGEDEVPDLVRAVKEEKDIFTFTFNYREDYEGVSAFLVENEGQLFLLTGYRAEFEFYSPAEAAAPVSDDEELEAEDLDFSVI